MSDQNIAADFKDWKQQLRHDCEAHGKLSAYKALGEPILRLLWEHGLEPTVQGVIKGVRENAAD